MTDGQDQVLSQADALTTNDKNNNSIMSLLVFFSSWSTDIILSSSIEITEIIYMYLGHQKDTKILTRLNTMRSQPNCTVGEHEVLSQKFSLKLSGNSSFCRENSTDNGTNQFLVKL